MNWLDLLLLGILIIAVIRGIVKGLFREAFGVGGVLAGAIISINRFKPLGEALHDNIPSLPLKLAYFLSFILILVVIAFIFTFIGILLHKTSRHSFTQGIDRGGGFILGFIEGAFIGSAILIGFTLSPFSARAEKWMEESTLSPHLIKVAPWVYDQFSLLFPGEKQKFLEKLEKLKRGLSKD